jgi:hypothetical protein
MEKSSCLPSDFLPDNLFISDSLDAKEFRTNIVQYNAALAFTSLGVKVDQSVLGRGPPVFRIHGELRHLSGSLLPEESTSPSYSQLYVVDPHEAYRYHILRNENLSLHTMQTLQQVMYDYNTYTPIYRHVYEVLQMYDVPDYTVKLCVLGNDPRWYNLPTTDEVGIILPENNSFPGDFCDIILHLRPRHYYNTFDNQGHVQLDRINEGHAAYAPLHYVLLFPYGESGWYYELHVPGNP